MGKVLGLDVGDKRVGVAIADESVPLAFPFACYAVERGVAEAQLIEIIKKEGVRRIVCGLPLSSDGRETPQCLKIRKFCRRLERRASVEIAFVDEHLSSEDAKQRLSERGGGKRHVDAEAATIILQSYLDETRGSRT